MRKMITMAVTAALAISTLTACGKTDKKETTASTAATTASTAASTAATTAATTASTEAKTEAKDTSAAAAESKADAQTPVSGSVATDGSTSMEKVIGALGEAFTKANPDATFTYNPTGSGSGITAVSEGRCDIGLSSRALKDEEKSQGLVETTLALDGIAIIVNKENTVEDLSLDDIAKIYTGEITNWSEVGGEDADIVLIGREAGSGTRDGFESITGTSDSCKYRQELTSTGDVITTVSSNPGAIGYASLAAVKDTVKKVSVDGVEATEETVKDGSYKVQRPFVLVTKDGTELSEAAQAFFDYVTSKDAADIISAAGAVPVAE
ncbi:MAG: phosphate ABC transporter substrate-binding protein [Lachnospiraceae bacterium]